jgi:WD40 repeat protein
MRLFIYLFIYIYLFINLLVFKSLTQEEEVVTSFATDPSGRWLVTCGYSLLLRQWDLRTGQCTTSWKAPHKYAPPPSPSLPSLSLPPWTVCTGRRCSVR